MNHYTLKNIYKKLNAFYLKTARERTKISTVLISFVVYCALVILGDIINMHRLKKSKNSVSNVYLVFFYFKEEQKMEIPLSFFIKLVEKINGILQ
jgi:hypothetical protein